MLQELTDLDFDTYFDVASSNQQQQQQQQQNRNMLYNENSPQQSNSLSLLLNSNEDSNRNCQYQQQQQQNFNLFDWDLSPPSSNHQSSISPMQLSPLSSPQSSSDGYTLHSLSPQMMSSPPLYTSYSDQQIKEEASKALEGFFAKRSMYVSVNPLQKVPGINIPTTPTIETPNMSISTASTLPSPPLDNPLSGAFSTIDQWCQNKGTK